MTAIVFTLVLSSLAAFCCITAQWFLTHEANTPEDDDK